VGTWERRGLRTEAEVPVNLERVLLLAARDPRFRETLLRDREAALAGHSLRLRDSERDALRATPPRVLAAMIEGTAAARAGRTPMGRAAAAAVAGTLLVSAGCPIFCGGAAPDPVYRDPPPGEVDPGGDPAGPSPTPDDPGTGGEGGDE
jgi:hypothetical protein